MNTLRPVGFQILPPVIKNLLIINGLLFFATYVFDKMNLIDLTNILALYHWDSPLFRPWQVVTHIFMHGDLGHLFFNMFALWMFGSVIENTLGPKRFLTFYMVCGFGAALLHLLIFTWQNYQSIQTFNILSNTEQNNIIHYILQLKQGIRAEPIGLDFLSQNQFESGVFMATSMVGASGAIFGVLFAFGYLFPNVEIFIYFLFPIKAKYFVAIYAVIALYYGIASVPGDNVAHFAHLGGMLFAFLLFRYWKISSNHIRRH